jgi:hypothetical protein
VIGQAIGNFRIVSRLGRGGMGEVWLAEQQSIGTKVAIKLLQRVISEDTDQVRRFFNEARAVSQIRHAGIVKIFDVGFHDGQAYLVMEHLEGETLGRRIRRLGRLRVGRLADVGRQIASVLDATHAAGITHRDLKPDNIFLVPDHELASRERVKVLDFGIAKLTGTIASGSPRTQGTLGTPGYMAPEQWGDAAKVDWRADAYSLGCVAFEMACGRPPFLATSYAEACAKHLHEAPPGARSLVPALPGELDQLLERLLAKAPGDRAGSMAEIGRAFAAIEARHPVEADSLSATLPALRDQQAQAHAETLPSGGDRSQVVTGGETLDDTTMGGAASQLAAPPPARRRRGLAVAGIGLAVVAAVVAFAATRPGGAGSPAAPPDAPRVVVAISDAAVIDRDELPPPAPVPAAVDAAPLPSPPAPVDARTKREVSAVRRPQVEPPDVLPPAEVSKVMDPLIRRARACGPWTNEDGYGADFTITYDGRVTELKMSGPDPVIAKCIGDRIQRARFPLSKHGIEVSQGISR